MWECAIITGSWLSLMTGEGLQNAGVARAELCRRAASSRINQDDSPWARGEAA